MSESKNVKPNIEDVIENVLNADVLENALSLIAYFRENKMKPGWSATNVWKISYKTYTVCFIRLYGAADYHNLKAGSWHIVPFIGEYEEDVLSDELKEIVWTNKTTCSGCGKCALELDKIFGKEFDYACEKSIVFTNPDTDAIECIKKLIDLRREDIKEGKAKKHKYIPMKKGKFMEIRRLTVADSSDLLDLLVRLDNETSFMMFEPDERDTTLENMQQRLSNTNESMLGAFDNEKLVGFISFSRGRANRVKHTAYIVMGVLSSHTGQGIGKLMLSSIEKLAIKQNVTRLELTVMTHNANAIRLYEKMGFVKEGVKKNAMLIDGNYFDEYYMGKILCV